MFSICSQNHLCLIAFLLIVVEFNHVKCPPDDAQEVKEKRYLEAVDLATNTFLSFLSLFDDCLHTTMIHQPFSVYDMQKFVMNPPRTTVGFVPKFTNQRKFFANLIGTTRFKEMLHHDVDKLRRKHVQKMKYCDSAIMDATLLKDFYDREVDQTKI